MIEAEDRACEQTQPELPGSIRQALAGVGAVSRTQSITIEPVGDGWVAAHTTYHSVSGTEMERQVFINMQHLIEWVAERL